MARIFISHSGRDNEAAARIKTWLKEQGFETLFLDFDKHAGIPPGADWERTLYREIEQSQAVIIIQTPNWLDSKWCFAEFTQARALGKAIFPVIEAPTGDTLISSDIQALDLRRDRDGGLEQLARQLTRIALDAQGGFAWDATRPPYPGLLAFQEEDAALYFGRDDDIRRLIERLNARRAQGGPSWLRYWGLPDPANRRSSGPVRFRDSSGPGATGSSCRRCGRRCTPSMNWRGHWRLPAAKPPTTCKVICSARISPTFSTALPAICA
jgi:hypothetical protein